MKRRSDGFSTKANHMQLARPSFCDSDKRSQHPLFSVLDTMRE